ncbi:MAG: hypothetical protein JO030_08925, partial [Candidatus Eremiobacteraeota bacterium]|nr:hypothetical protein [Candidatus Eremiobacteraeota bacterium]
TSAVARGLGALSVALGNDFLDAQPENPTGYWEDRGVVEIDERALRMLGLRWDDSAPIRAGPLLGLCFWRMRRRAARYLRRTFGAYRVWGFKDPRTIRVLPFWRAVLRSLRVDDSYIVVVRHPRSVAASLFARQKMDEECALRLWLAHMVPFLRELAGLPWIVVDYDLLMQRPREQLQRIADALALPTAGPGVSREIDRFADEFLDRNLRHTLFASEDLGGNTAVSRIARNAYRLLHDVAGDRIAPNAPAFWTAWQQIERNYASLAEQQTP